MLEDERIYFFFFYILQSDKFFLSFPIGFYPAEVEAQPHSTVWTGLIFKECLGGCLRTSKHFACGCCMSEQPKGKAQEPTILWWPLRDTALLLWIKQQAQARSGCSSSSERSWWKPWHIPSHLSQCYTSLLVQSPTSLHGAFQGKMNNLKTSFAHGVLVDTFSCISSDGYVQSPFPLVLQPQGQLVPHDYSLELRLGPKIMWRAWIRGPDQI